MRILIFLFLVFFLTGCVSSLFSGPLEQCEKKTNEERNLCYYGAAKETKELSYCTQITEAELRNNCINFLSN